MDTECVLTPGLTAAPTSLVSMVQKVSSVCPFSLVMKMGNFYKGAAAVQQFTNEDG